VFGSTFHRLALDTPLISFFVLLILLLLLLLYNSQVAKYSGALESSSEYLEGPFLLSIIRCGRIIIDSCLLSLARPHLGNDHHTHILDDGPSPSLSLAFLLASDVGAIRGSIVILL